MAALTRRTLGWTLISAAGLSQAGLGQPAFANVVCETAATNYHYRLRYYRSNRRVLLWTRVRDARSPVADVPFTVVLSADRPGSRIIHQRSYTSVAVASHVVRAGFHWRKDALPKGAMVYCRLLIGAERLPTRSWMLKA